MCLTQYNDFQNYLLINFDFFRTTTDQNYNNFEVITFVPFPGNVRILGRCSQVRRNRSIEAAHGPPFKTDAEFLAFSVRLSIMEFLDAKLPIRQPNNPKIFLLAFGLSHAFPTNKLAILYRLLFWRLNRWAPEKKLFLSSGSDAENSKSFFQAAVFCQRICACVWLMFRTPILFRCPQTNNSNAPPR